MVQLVTVDGANRFEGFASLVPGGNTITVAATDLGNAVTTKQYSLNVTADGEKSYSFDDNGNLSTITEGASVTALNWDPLDRLVSVVKGTHTSTFKYDALGRMLKNY